MRFRMQTPQPKQIEFLNARVGNVCFGGARGGGKSWVVRTKCKCACLFFPGIKTLIVRRTYPELYRNHIRILRRELIDVAKYNDKEKLIEWENGSTISFMYCKNDKDVDMLQGAEFDMIFFDEATQLSEYQMTTISACCRGTNDFPKRIYYTCNPGGQGHAYIKRLFITKEYKEDEDPEDYLFIQSLVTDNYILMNKDPKYLKKLDRLPEKLKRAWRYGDWDIFEGMFFDEFRTKPDIRQCAEHDIDPDVALKQRRWTHVIDPFNIPNDWIIYRSFDWGSFRPFSCGWWAVDHKGTLYRILEYYGCKEGEANTGLKMTSDEVFAEIHKFESEHEWLKGKQIHGVADPAIWIKDHTGISIYDTAVANGVYFSKGDNSRVPGWEQVHNRLKFDKAGYPKMYIFNTCKDFIRTIPLLMHDEHKVEDVDTDGEDHIADETRYMCMKRPLKPIKPKEKDPYFDSSLWQALSIPKENLADYNEPEMTFTVKEK